MKKAIIGIVGRWKDDSIMVYEEYVLAILKSGGIPFLILPNYEDFSVNILPFCNDMTVKQQENIQPILDFCDGFLFPGGSRWYGFDEVVYDYAFQHDKPVLGICLGMQMIANYPNFKCQNADTTHLINHHQSKQKYVHPIFLKPSKLRDILNIDCIFVNSRHQSAICENGSFQISSLAEDGVIESIEIPFKKFIIGVQWHPESLFDEDVFAQKIFSAFVFACF